MDAPALLRRLHRDGAISLAVFPLLLIVAFSLHFLGEFTPADLLVLRFSYLQPPPQRFMELFRSDSPTAFVLPHLLIYLALPLLIPIAAHLGALLFGTMPRLALAGSLATLAGVIFMGGVFGSWLSFTAIGQLPEEQVAASLPALAALIRPGGLLLATSLLASSSLLGVMILAAGLLFKGVLPRLEAGLILVGTAVILVFMDIDNLMLVGAMLWFLGSLPSLRRLLALAP